jgi:DNA-binding CsgD family transcriptional regulator/tetratricopeptide (TPR) repeat protein
MGGRMASPTFVGRVEELELLEAARRRAATTDPAVVLVGGDAGVGKTRLVTELAARCTTDGTRVLVGGCIPVGGDGLPYAPIVEALRPLPDELGVETARELAGPSWRELARLLPSLGEPSLDLAGQAAQARLFELLLGLLGRLGQQAPLMLVVEDLHWSDRSTRDLLAFLVRNLHRERVLLVVTYRNDEPGQQRLGSYLAELDRGGRVQRLELPRLDRADTAAQLSAILGTTPAVDLVDGMFARSEGNPFFTEELLECVRAGSATLPTTLRDLLQGRIEALPEPTQQVLRVAAVAGREVPHPLLAAVAGLDEEQLEGALRAAVTHQLLITHEDCYQFRHALLREVIDTRLLAGERVRLHAAYAHALIARPELSAGSPALAAAELAIHWDAAGELDRALPARVEAGLAAEQAHAFPEAQRHYDRALQLWERVPDPGRPAGLDQVDLLGRAAESAAFTGAVKRGVGLLEEALGRVDPADEPVRTAELHGRLGDYRLRAGDEAGTLRAFEQAEQLLAGRPPSAEQARVLGAYARALMVVVGHSEEVVKRCEEAIAVARSVGARAEEARALRVLAGSLNEMGESDRAITLMLEARSIAEQVGDAETVVDTHITLSYMLSFAGRERDALKDAQQGYQRAHEFGLERAGGSFVAANVAWGLLNLGRWQECERLTSDLLATDRWGAFTLHTVQGVLLSRRGDFRRGREQFEQALRLSSWSYRDLVWLGAAELALCQGRHDEASMAVAEGLRWCAERDPDGILPRYSCFWYAMALRLHADQAEQAAARRTADAITKARKQAVPIVAKLDRLTAAPTPQVRYPIVTAHLQLARAEQSRLEGRSDPRGWRAATLAWERLEYPFNAAYARFREAEALLAGGASRQQAEPVLRAAHQTTVTLGAGPLRREIELLAQRGRLHLEEPVDAATEPKAPPSPAASLGLTQREAEVLALVAEGRTNRQIGQALFITPKTASIHVSRILAKLGVAGRGEAAAIAHRLGLDKR